MANNFFGSPAAAIGKTMRYDNRKDFTVSAVFEDLNSHVSEKFDFLLSWEFFMEENKTTGVVDTPTMKNEDIVDGTVVAIEKAALYVDLGIFGTGIIYGVEFMNARDVIKRFTDEKEIDKAFIIYNEFKSVLQQRVVTEQLLPVARGPSAEAQDSGAAAQPVTLVDYIYEQPPQEIFAKLLPRLVETQVFRALLESIASEQGARMTAMDSASKNARELIDSLTLNMNRVRQAAITNEIIEVVSGAAAQ